MSGNFDASKDISYGERGGKRAADVGELDLTGEDLW